MPAPADELRANLKSISHLFEVAFIWELTEETIHLPLGCLQGGRTMPVYTPGLLRRMMVERITLSAGVHEPTTLNPNTQDAGLDARPCLGPPGALGKGL